uniref:flagellar hook-basal body complex protein FliE n=1 Tax=Desulforadius tongensis TaxID=1216062 RepID=UPI001EE5FB63|nr:flagellar hook-basal body complex protein FliE [Desulforadius tongensis]
MLKKTDSKMSFGEVLNDAISKLNEIQLHADEVKLKFVTGEVQDIHQVTIAMQEAKIAMQLAVEVRNKLLEAYQEVSRMPL